MTHCAHKTRLLSACINLVEREGRFGQQGEEVYTLDGAPFSR